MSGSDASLIDFLAGREHRTIGQTIAEGGRRFAGRPFVTVVDGVSLTYQQVDELTSRFADYLRERGVTEGDHVLVMLPNDAGIVLSFFAVEKLGAVVVPVAYAAIGELLRHVVEHAEVKTAILDRESAQRVHDAGVRDLPTVVVEPPLVIDGKPLGQLGGAAVLPTPKTSWRDLAAIVYTGGTTGRSKGVMISHNYALAEGGLFRPPEKRLTAQDVYYCCLPLHHGILFVSVLGPWIAGGRLVVAPRFSAARFWNDVRRHGATVTMLVGSMVPYLYRQAQRPDDADNPLRTIWGNPMPAEIHRQFEQRFGVELLDSFAMTEASPVTASFSGQSRVGSCGRAVRSSFDVQIVDENDEPAPTGEVGELVVRPVRPHTMMEGYYKAPDETLRSFRNLWFHTGDLAYVDGDGYFYIVGRSKDSIRRRGASVSAREIEEVLANRVPDVVEVAVVGVRDEFGDEEIKAVFEMRAGCTLDISLLRSILETQLAKEMRPRFVSALPTLPRTELGRIRKADLAKRDSGDVDLWQQPTPHAG